MFQRNNYFADWDRSITHTNFADSIYILISNFW